MLFFAILLSTMLVAMSKANTEKVVFIAPRNVQIPLQHPTLEDLQLETLSPQHWSLRTHIRAEFPTEDARKGLPSWYLLGNMKEGQRYEVRICWAATQPTAFDLTTYPPSTVFETPELVKSLANYSESRQSRTKAVVEQHTNHLMKSDLKEKSSSTLFLQIFAAADYYTMNQSYMDNVPPVHVDILLDPYIFNVLPRTLRPTAAYLILLAIGSWFIAKHISGWLQAMAYSDTLLERKLHYR